jgi:SP family arabinose:H+ symporter-like MFS transporter
MNNKENVYLIFISLVAALGGLLFGFDTAVISGTTPYIQPFFHLSELGLGWTVSSLLGGCIIGVAFAGKIGDQFGRRLSLIISSILFFLSAIGSALVSDITLFIIFRIIGGLAVGIASMLSPMYISEISPARQRGRLVSLYQLAIVVGILLAFISNVMLKDVGENNWRWMLAVMALPAFLFFIFLFFAPESPRWLVQKNQLDLSLKILIKINGQEKAEVEIENIKSAIIRESDQGTYRELLSPKVRPILFLGIFLAVFSQITGINSIMYYAPVIFQSIGKGIGSAITQTAFIGGINLVFTILAIYMIDKIGRRRLLIGGVIGMIVSLTAITVAFYLKIHEGFFILFFILFYIASFAISLGPLTWVIISEIFPNKLRSKAMSVAVLCLWLANFLLILVFPWMLANFGGATTFLFFTIMCIILLLVTLYKLPETGGQSLEELESKLIGH